MSANFNFHGDGDDDLLILHISRLFLKKSYILFNLPNSKCINGGAICRKICIGNVPYCCSKIDVKSLVFFSKQFQVGEKTQ